MPILKCILKHKIENTGIDDALRLIKKYAKKTSSQCLKESLQLFINRDISLQHRTELLFILSELPEKFSDTVHSLSKMLIFSAKENPSNVVLEFLKRGSVRRLIALLDQEAKERIKESLEESPRLVAEYCTNKRKIKQLMRSLNINVLRLLRTTITLIPKKKFYCVIELIRGFSDIGLEAIIDHARKTICNESLELSSRFIALLWEYLIYIYGLDKTNFALVTNRELYFLKQISNDFSMAFKSITCIDRLAQTFLRSTEFLTVQAASALSIALSRGFLNEIIINSVSETLQILLEKPNLIDSPSRLIFVLNIAKDRFFEDTPQNIIRSIIAKIPPKTLSILLRNIVLSDFELDPIVRILCMYEEAFCQYILNIDPEEFFFTLDCFEGFTRILFEWECVWKKLQESISSKPKLILSIKKLPLDVRIAIRIIIKKNSELQRQISENLQPIEIKELIEVYKIPLQKKTISIESFFKQIYMPSTSLVLQTENINKTTVMRYFEKYGIKEITNFVANFILLGYRDFIKTFFTDKNLVDILFKKLSEADLDSALRFLCLVLEFNLINADTQFLLEISKKLQRVIEAQDPHKIIETTNNLSVMVKYGTCIRHTLFCDDIAQSLIREKKRYRRSINASLALALIFTLSVTDPVLNRIYRKISGYSKLLQFLSGLETIYIAFQESKIGSTSTLRMALQNIIANEQINRKTFEKLTKILEINSPKRLAKKLASLFQRYPRVSILKIATKKTLERQTIEFNISILKEIIENYTSAIYSGALIPLVVSILETIKNQLDTLPEEERKTYIRRIRTILQELSDMLGIRRMLLSILGA